MKQKFLKIANKTNQFLYSFARTSLSHLLSALSLGSALLEFQPPTVKSPLLLFQALSLELMRSLRSSRLSAAVFSFSYAKV